jgi:RecA/RadA recombinase
MAVDFFRKFINDLDESDTSVAADGKSAAEFHGYIDTGSYILNAALSGTIFGGIPNNKAVVFAGDPATGKTFFTLGVVKRFLEENKDARVFYFDTESAVTNQMLTERDIDITRVAKSEPDSIERFRTVALKVLDNYAQIPEEKRFPLLIVLDSISMLPSKKEVADITDGKDTKDMTKTQLLKGAFRVLRLKMAKVGVPMIITNHIYQVIGSYVPTKEMAGGSGAKYAADSIIFLSKKAERDGDNQVVGNVIHIKMVKSRLSKEGTKVDTRILYSGGLDRYYGLLPLAEAAGIVKKVSTRFEFPDGTKAFEKAINREPEKFWTQDILNKLDAYVQTQFKYTAGTEDESADSEEEADD